MRYQVLFQTWAQCDGNFCKLQQIYGDSVLSRAQVFRWFKALSEGRDSIEDELRSGRPSTGRSDENVHRIRNIVLSDRRLTVRMIGEELNLTHTTVHQILINELGMKKICAKMVPKNLSQDQKDNSREICLDFLGRIENDPHFLECIITGDESWITRKRSTRARNGTLQTHHGQKKPE